MHSQGHSKLHVREADYKPLQSQKADTTNFPSGWPMYCSLLYTVYQLTL
jgi:hypothetical protein